MLTDTESSIEILWSHATSLHWIRLEGEGSLMIHVTKLETDVKTTLMNISKGPFKRSDTIVGASRRPLCTSFREGRVTIPFGT